MLSLLKAVVLVYDLLTAWIYRLIVRYTVKEQPHESFHAFFSV
jgi:hypothetical protein